MANGAPKQNSIAMISGCFAILAAIIGGIFLLANTFLEKKLDGSAPDPQEIASPANTSIPQVTPTFKPTQSPSFSTSPGSNSIMYIYSQSIELANEYQLWLTNGGYEVSTVDITQVKTLDLSKVGLIIVGSDTLGPSSSEPWYSGWGDRETVEGISNSGRPVLGLGDGGYGVFYGLQLRIGGGFGAQGEGNGTVQLKPYGNILKEPNNMPEGEITLYSVMVSQREIYLGEEYPPTPKSVGVVEIGSTSYSQEGQTFLYSPVLMQQEKYFFWGFNASPSLLTEDGKKLFLNIVYFLLAR